MCATKLAFVHDVFATKRIDEHICLSRRTIYVSDACRFPFWLKRDSISVILECGTAMEWLVERRYDRQHVQAIRVYVGRETTNAVFYALIVEIPALERDDGCHQVGIGPGWSQCGRHNVWRVKRSDAESITF